MSGSGKLSISESESKSESKSKVIIYLATGFEEIEALAVVDILRRANITVDMVSIQDSLEVVGGHEIKVVADKKINEISPTDYQMMILPGGMPGTTNLTSCELLKKHIIDFDLEDKYIGAICAAPSILGNMGLLENKEVTCYPDVEDKLLGANYRSDIPVVVDKNIITSRGAGTAMDFGVELVRILKDKETSLTLKKSLLMC